MRHFTLGCLSAALLGVIAGPVMAADYTPAPAAPAGWILTLGVEGRVGPAFDGSDHWSAYPLPLFDLRRAGTPEKFRAPRDGAGISLFETGGLRIGPVGKLKLPRRESKYPAELAGLGDVGWAVEIGGFVEYWWTPWLRTRAELRAGIGGHSGLAGDLFADFVVPLTSQWTLSGGPRLSLASADALSPYFGVTAQQALTSGLPAYDVGGGIRAYGVGAQLRYRWNPQWATHAFVEYERLAGDVADSPIVSMRGSANQTTIGAGITYSFAISGF